MIAANEENVHDALGFVVFWPISLRSMYKLIYFLNDFAFPLPVRRCLWYAFHRLIQFFPSITNPDRKVKTLKFHYLWTPNT